MNKFWLTICLCIYSNFILAKSHYSHNERTADSTYFNGKIFINEFDIFNPHKSADLTFVTCKFKEGLLCGETFLNNIITFEGDSVMHSFVFVNDTLNSSVTFKQSVFNDDVTFWESTFIDELQFDNCTFSKEFSLSKCQIQNNADFFKVTFKDIADFSDLKIINKAVLDFSYSTLPWLLNMSNIKIYDGYVDLSKSNAKNKIGYKSYINLYKSDIDKIHFEYTNLNLCFFNLYDHDDSMATLFSEYLRSSGNDTNIAKTKLRSNKYCESYIRSIFPNKCDYADSVKTKYINLAIKKAFFPKPLSVDEINAIYESILKNLEKSGQNISYQNLEIEYKVFKDHSFLKWMSSLNRWWWNFGYNKEKIFIHALIFLLIFITVTFFILPFLHNNVYELSAIKENENNIFFSEFRTRLWYSFVYTSVVFFLFSLKIENFKFNSKVRTILGTIYIVIMYSTGVACIAYMANFVLQK